MARRCLTVGLLSVVLQAASVREDATPLIKVVQMLNAMLDEAKIGKQKESVEFARFAEYCDGTRKETDKAIKTGQENIVQLSATIDKANADAEELAEDIKELQADVTKMMAQAKEASEVRKKERAHYEETHKDFTESCDAIAKALKVVKSKDKDIPQALLQLQSSTLISERAKAEIQSFVALGDSDEAAAVPKANAYEFQSGGIVAILEKLRLKFQDQKRNLEKEEASTKGSFELLMKRLADSVKNTQQSIADKTSFRGKKLEIASDAKGDLDIAKKGKDADEKKLSALNTECDAKSLEYNNNQETRADEIKAMITAIDILNSNTVSGAATKHKMTLLQDGALSLLQIKRIGSEETDQRKHLVAYLQRKAQSLGSRYLSVVAARALTDPMIKVKKMIKELIIKLMEEANAEADQKGWCDKELEINKFTRDHKTEDVDELTAEIEKLTADVAKMKEDIGTVSEQMSDLRSNQKKATEARNDEKALNTETISEAKNAQVAVEKATQVLKSFYAKASDTSLIQEDDSETDSMSEDMAELSSAPYQGMQSKKGGVIGMLEVILSDFAKLEAKTSTAEDEAATKYEKFMDSSNQDLAVKEAEVEHLTKKVRRTEERLRNLKKELQATQDELDAALAYYEKLKPDCVDASVSYQERVEMRQAEIQSLQEALATLSMQTS